jgi:hypothetical protein
LGGIVKFEVPILAQRQAQPAQSVASVDDRDVD